MAVDNNASEARSGRWSSLTRFAAPFQREQGEMVLLTNAERHELLLAERGALLDLLTSEFLGEAERSDSATTLDQELQRRGLRAVGDAEAAGVAQAAHWWEREWSGPLDYYLWSRRWHYRDADDRDGAERRDTLRAYVQSGGPPPERLRPAGEALTLPAARPLPAERSLGEELLQRRTIRRYVQRDASRASLSAILWHGLAGVRLTREAASEDELLHYLESYGVAFDFYLVVYAVSGIAPGVYYYDLEAHALVLLCAGDFREQMTTNLFGQTAPMSAAWTILLSADYVQYAWRYRHERALRNLYIDAGRVAQNLILIAGAYDLGSFMTPALRDRAVASLLQLDPERQAPLYSVTMGLNPAAR